MSKFLGFFATFCIIFAITVAFMIMTDTLPEPLTSGHTQEEPLPDGQSAGQGVVESPVRIVAKDIDLDSVVLNPSSTDVEALDEELLKGAVHYPSSAQLGENGTVLIFGHSSYLPIVHNQSYKAFNGIQKLKTGQIISVFSEGREYRYAVTSVRVANAKEDVVELPSDREYLTLITCDSFASKSDRFVVTAVRAL